MKYVIVEVADCDEEPMPLSVDRFVEDLESNYPIVVSVKVLDNKPKEA